MTDLLEMGGEHEVTNGKVDGVAPKALEKPRRVPNVELPPITQPRDSVVRDHPLLDILRRRVEAAVEGELRGTDWTAHGCPWLEYWFAYYEARSPEHLESALRKYTGTTGEDLVEPTVERVRQSVVRWRATGEIDAPAAEIPKPIDVLAKLGPGHPLESSVRDRMESAMGVSFADARIHTDGPAQRVASSESARALAVGSHVAFGAEQYQPGTIEGDALLAHELAHTAQQRGVTGVASTSAAMEHSADRFTLAALGRARGVGGAMPALGRAPGLQLQRCGPKKPELAKDAGGGSGSGSGSAIAPAPPKLQFTPTGHDFIRGQRVDAIQPSDVAESLIGELFELRADQAGGSAGTKVRPTMWVNDDPTVVVALDSNPAVTFPARKTNLKPVAAKVGNVVLYQAQDTSLDDQLATIRMRQGKSAALANDKTSRASDRKAAEDLATTTEAALNEMLIRQQMVNRFDQMIDKKTKEGNAKWDKNKDPLDPNIVKSIIYRESQMGTSGAFLGDTTSPDPFIMNHWNITQAIDSAGEMYAHYFQKERPDLEKKYKLEKVINTEHKQHDRYEEIRNEPRTSELTDLEDHFTHVVVHKKDKTHKAQWTSKEWSSEKFYFAFPGFVDALVELWGSSHLNETYEHWIEMLIFELFWKYDRVGHNWAKAVEAYNGQNKHYLKEVMDRVKDSENQGDGYVPHHDGE